MAEKSRCLAEQDHAILEKVDESSSTANVRNVSSNMDTESLVGSDKSQSLIPSISSVPPSNVLQDNETSSSDESNAGDEINQLRRHQNSLRQRSYVSAAAEDNHIELQVSFPDPNNGLGCPRSRTVLVAGSISPKT